jgi:Kef-type K+ transport system membrane component KefB
VLQDLAGTTAALVVIALLGLEGGSVGVTLLLMVAFVAMALVAAWLLPIVLRALRAHHDLFLITSVSSALVIAGVGAEAFGVPLALAAFVGGLAVGESHEASAARERLLPFRDLSPCCSSSQWGRCSIRRASERRADGRSWPSV